MTTALKRTGAALLTLLMFCMLTLGASAAANTPVGVKFWKENSDKESMANSGIDSDREATLARQSNGTYTLTLPVKQVTKLNVTGCLTGLTIGDVTYNGTVTGDVTKDTGVLTIKNLPASVLTGSDVNKALTVTCNIQMDLSLLGEINTPARMDGSAYGMAALEHYQTLGLQFDCIYTGYLGGEAQVALAEKAFALWPAAYKVVDPVMGDNGKAYSTVTPALVERIRSLCRAADLILPNYTEAQLLLQQQPVTEQLDDAAAQALADALQPLASNAVVTGLPLGKYIGCAGTGAARFVIKKLHISRSFPGTGDLYGAVLIGSLLQGNALSAAADNAAEFVSLAIQGTPYMQDTRFGVWFEPLLPRLCPLREEPEGIL